MADLANRTRVPLVFGQGLDRSTGKMAVEPSRPQDIRNFHLYEGKAELRKGYLAAVGPLTVPAGKPTDAGATCGKILAIQPLQSDGSAIVVGLIGQNLHVWRVEGDASGFSYVAFWHTIPTGGVARVRSCETYGVAVLAHDEPALAKRGATMFYCSRDVTVYPGGILGDAKENYSAGTLNALTSKHASPGEEGWATGQPKTKDGADNPDWSDAEKRKIRFRGVCTHLGYLWGWGFGDNTEDRPDLVRSSMPGQPLVFESRHHASIGQRGNPVLRCIPTGTVLLCMQSAESYRIEGYDRYTFGVRPADARYGARSSGLACEVNGVAYVWTQEGPRRSDGGEFHDLALPLDLIGEEPQGLVLLGDGDFAHAFYVPDRREVVFSFGRRGYALSLFDPAAPKWSYREWAVEPIAAGLMYGGSPVPNVAPTGSPIYEAPGDADADGVATVQGNTTLEIWWSNRGQVGTESVDLFYRVTGSGAAWTKVLVGQVSANSTQKHDLTGLVTGTQYDIALRYRNKTLTTPGYESDDPTAWTDDLSVTGTPADSKGTATTTLAAPTGATIAWSRTSSTREQVRIAWTDASANPVEIVRGGVVIAEVAAGVQEFINGSDDATNPIAGETSYTYYIRHKTADATGAQVNLDVWTGPAEPTADTMTLLSNGGTINFTAGRADAETEIYDSIDSANTGTPDNTVAAGANSGNFSFPAQASGTTVQSWVRHKLTTHTVADYSPMSNVLEGTVP